PEQLVVAEPERAEGVSDASDAACRAAGLPAPRLESGQAAVTELAGRLGPAAVVPTAITGSVGLVRPLAVLSSGARLALADEVSLVGGGARGTRAAAPGQILPVASEHTAIAQALAGVRPEQVDRLAVTASGGPFRGRTRDQLADI